jgi:hypothetical protein
LDALLNEIFGPQLATLGAALKAVVLLLSLPFYYFILFAMGTYLFFRSSRLRIEQRHHIDLLLKEFPALEQRYPTRRPAQASERSGGDRRPAAPVQESEDQADIAEVSREPSDPTDAVDSSGSAPAADQPEQERPAPEELRGSKEAIWRIAIHDAPLMILSAAIVISVLTLLSLLEPAIGGDPLARLTGTLFGGDGASFWNRFFFGPSSFIVPTLLYSILGALGLAILPGMLSRLLSLEWHHLEPHTWRGRIVKRLWRRLCFVNLSRLDGSVGHWLVWLLGGHVVFLIAADFLALYNGFRLPPAMLAGAHLLPVAMPRLFAQVWSSPIDFSRPPGRGGPHLEPDELAAHLARPEYLGDFDADGGTTVRELHTVLMDPANPVRHRSENLPRRMEQALEASNRPDLAPFLAAAVDALFDRGTSLVLSGPEGSGRDIVTTACSLEAAFRGMSSLLLVRTRQDAARVVRQLRELSRAYPAAAYYTAVEATDESLYEIRELADRVVVLVADLQSFDRIAEHNSYLGFFWQRLGFAALVGLDETTPQERAELPFLTTRLVRCGGSPGTNVPLLMSVLDGAHLDHASFSRILHQEFESLPLGYAWPTRIRLFELPRPGRDAVAVDRDLTVAHRFAAGLADAGYSRFFLSIGGASRASLQKLDLAGACTRVDALIDDSVVVSLVELRPETFFTQVSKIRELSRWSPTDQHLCFLLPPVDGFGAWMQSHLDDYLQFRRDSLTPLLIPGHDNVILQRKHMLRSVLERPASPADLDRMFGAGPTEGLLQEIRRGDEELPRELELVVDPLHGELARFSAPPEGHLPGTSAGRGAIRVGPDTGSVTIRCRDLGLERQVDAQRLGQIFWPARVFDLDGRRLRVRERRPATSGVVECDPEPEELRTYKIRRLFITGSRDIRLTSDHVYDRDGIGIYRALLDFRETIVGYRTWKGRDLVEESTYGVGAQVVNEFTADAVVLFFPGLDPETVHLAAHVFKRYLKLVCGDDDDVIDATHGCFEPFSKGVSDYRYHDVTILDNVPGGTGICDLVTPELVRKVAAMVVEMDEEGAAWYQIQDCHATRLGKFDSVPPDAAPDSDRPPAVRLIDYMRRVVLAEERTSDDEPLDYSLGLWIEDPPPSTAEDTTEPAPASGEVPTPEEEEPEAALTPSARMIERVYADAERIGRPARKRSEE